MEAEKCFKTQHKVTNTLPFVLKKILEMSLSNEEFQNEAKWIERIHIADMIGI